MNISSRIHKYTRLDPKVPVWCITPEGYGSIHRFFDTSPVSPSGRYVGLTRILDESRLPRPGDPAEVVVVDLENGTQRVVATTHGWDTQLGAQVQWGRDDTELYYNDVDPESWKPFGVKINPITGATKNMEGTVYMISPDGKRAASPSLQKMGLTQAGYGVIVPAGAIRPNHQAPEDDGIFITDTETGKVDLLVSLSEIVTQAIPLLPVDEYQGGDFYGFHVKWNPRGDRILFVLRWIPDAPPDGKKKHNAITLSDSGRDIRVAVSEDDWGRGGHHPNWCPDSDSVMMNLKVEGHLRFVRAHYTGGAIEVLAPRVLGSGHPSLHPNGRHIVTDAYAYEPMADETGTVPIRWIDLVHGTEENLLRISTEPAFPGPKLEYRIDPHPAWDRSHSCIVFNGAKNGRRLVYLADLTELI